MWRWSRRSGRISNSPKRALENGKHVFVEKPFTTTSEQAEELIELAERKNLKIMVDHTFLFTGAVRKIKQLIDARELGELYYYDTTRVNLGLFQHDVNVIWDLAPHDLSIMDYLLSNKPEAVVATGQKHVNGVEDVAYITVYYANKLIAHVNVNWLSPVKVRTTLVGGDKKMLMWNDLESDEKIRIYDKGVSMSANPVTCINCWSATGPATCGRRSWSRGKRSAPKRPISSSALKRTRNHSTTGKLACVWSKFSRPPTGRCAAGEKRWLCERVRLPCAQREIGERRPVRTCIQDEINFSRYCHSQQ